MPHSRARPALEPEKAPNNSLSAGVVSKMTNNSMVLVVVSLFVLAFAVNVGSAVQLSGTNMSVFDSVAMQKDNITHQQNPLEFKPVKNMHEIINVNETKIFLEYEIADGVLEDFLG